MDVRAGRRERGRTQFGFGAARANPGPHRASPGFIVHRPDDEAAEPGLPTFFESTAIIDTGASGVCVDYRIAHALKLPQVDSQTINTVGGPIHTAIHLAALEVP